MRHKVQGRKFGMKRGRRQSFVRNLVVEMIKRERIETTEARAKEIRPRVERMVHIGKQGTLAARRLLLSRLNNNTTVVRKLVETIAPRYAERPGGYVRIVKTARARKRDGAHVAVIEFV